MSDKKQPRARSIFLATSLCLFLPSVLKSNESSSVLKVLVNHAPASFREVLKDVDVRNEIITSEDMWFDPKDAEVWVIFLNSKEDELTLPVIARKVIKSIENSKSDLSRLTATLSRDIETGTEEKSIIIQINNISNSRNSVNFLGCVAALDIASIIYGPTLVSDENVTDKCLKYSN